MPPSLEVLLLSSAAAVLPLALLLLVLMQVTRSRVPGAWGVGLCLWGLLGAGLLSLWLVRGLLSTLGLEEQSSARLTVAVLFLGPIIEEGAKGLGVLWAVLLGARRWSARQGAVLGAAAGLGFAMAENQQAFLQLANDGAARGELLVHFLSRTFVTAPMHAVCSAMIGGGSAWGMQRGRPRWIGLLAGILGLVAAVKLHALWNLAALLEVRSSVSWVGMVMVWVACLGTVMIVGSVSEAEIARGE